MIDAPFLVIERRHGRGDRRALDAGNRLDARQQLIEESPARLGGRVVRRRQLHPHAGQAVDVRIRRHA